jgi:hypothetical protein
MLAYYNLVSPVTDLFGSKGLEYLDKILPILQPAAKQVVMDSLDMINHINRHIEKLEKELELTPE